MKTNQIMMLPLLLLGVSLGREAQAFYNPSGGHWPSRDPIGERGGRNLYSFTKNRPLVSWDRLGLVAAGDDDDSTTTDGDSITWLYDISGSADVAVEYDGNDICHSRNLTVTITFAAVGETDESFQQGIKFFCDGAETSTTEGTDWKATKIVVKCKKRVQYCGDKKKESALTVKGVYHGSKRQPNGSGSAAAKVTWGCNACCEVENPLHTTWTFTGAASGFPRK